MAGERSEADVTAGIRRTLDAAVDELVSSGAREEALADYVASHRVFLFERGAAMSPRGRVWRLGVFLLARDRSLYATGLITRALDPGRPAFQSVSAETRRAYRAAAFKGPFENGETVNFDAVPIDIDAVSRRTSDGPLFIDGGRALVKWNSTLPRSEASDFDAYIRDRVALLAHPPEGA